MNEREALNLALAVLESYAAALALFAAIPAIKEVLAQPSEEPVGKYSDIISDGGLDPRNTTPPQRTWVGLTDDEIDLIDESNWEDDHKVWGIHKFARAIEAKLKEKNT